MNRDSDRVATPISRAELFRLPVLMDCSPRHLNGLGTVQVPTHRSSGPFWEPRQTLKLPVIAKTAQTAGDRWDSLKLPVLAGTARTTGARWDCSNYRCSLGLLKLPVLAGAETCLAGGH